MLKIKLSDNNNFKTWNIVSHERVTTSRGRTRYKIIYKSLRENTDGRIVNLIVIFFKIGTTFGIILIYRDFRHHCVRCLTKPYAEIFQQEVLSSDSLEDHLWQKIHALPCTQQLYNQALQEQRSVHFNGNHLRIKFCTPTQNDHASVFGASASIHQGKVTLCLNKKNEDDLFSSLIFELTNLMHVKRFDDLSRKVQAREFTTEEDYAREAERTEYDGVQICKRILKEVGLEHLKRWSWVSDNFSEYWEQIRMSSHTEYHRRTYRLIHTQAVLESVHLGFRGRDVRVGI